MKAGYAWPGAGLIFAYAFAGQIYCDFSAYTDIARGSAKLVGIDLVLNFRTPYFASSPSDFWRRWHISLSTWLRDYLYIPLGGNRHGRWHEYRNLMLTMILGGLWHGAGVLFIAWGVFHGLILTLQRIFPYDRSSRTGPGCRVARSPSSSRPVGRVQLAPVPRGYDDVPATMSSIGALFHE